MKSVGATNSFVRWPFLIEGMIIGLISAIVSTGEIAILYETAQALVYQIVPIDFIPINNVIWIQAACLQLQVLLSASSAALFQSEKTLKWKVTKYSVGNPDRNLKGGDYNEQIKNPLRRK